MSDTVVANTTARVAGTRRMVVKGETWPASDPVVVAHPGLFLSPDEAAEQQRKPQSTAELGERSMSSRLLNRKNKGRPVEQATAAPGETRTVGHACDADGCDFVAKSAAGLAAHGRAHD